MWFNVGEINNPFSFLENVTLSKVAIISKNHDFPPEQHVFEIFENICKRDSDQLQLRKHDGGDQIDC